MIRAYEAKDLPSMIAIWNEVVEEGIAFPQEEQFVSMEGNVLCMTSDGECWVCDLGTGKENTIGMPIVAFDHRVSFDAEIGHRDVPNAFIVYGTGCFWGFEGYPQEFEIYVDKDTLEARYQDVWDEEEGYEEYRKIIDGGDEDGAASA